LLNGNVNVDIIDDTDIVKAFMTATQNDLESGAMIPKRKWSYLWKAMTAKFHQGRTGLVRLPGPVPQYLTTNLAKNFLSMKERTI
jgi:hypothetical protein